MIVGYVLIITKTGKEQDVLKKLENVEHITEVLNVYGQYDVFARVETENLKQLDKAVTSIRSQENVEQTITLVSFNGK